MRNEVEDAIMQTIRTVRTKNDAFLVLCSLNLLNAAVKKEEYKELIGYGLIKPSIAKLLQFCIANENRDLVDEIYYDEKGQCAYIRCFGIQFSFHNIGRNRLGEEFINSSKNKKVDWDGIKLQPIALELYHLANECINDNIDDVSIVQEKFRKIEF